MRKASFVRPWPANHSGPTAVRRTARLAAVVQSCCGGPAVEEAASSAKVKSESAVEALHANSLLEHRRMVETVTRQIVKLRLEGGQLSPRRGFSPCGRRPSPSLVGCVQHHLAEQVQGHAKASRPRTFQLLNACFAGFGLVQLSRHARRAGCLPACFLLGLAPHQQTESPVVLRAYPGGPPLALATC